MGNWTHHLYYKRGEWPSSILDRTKINPQAFLALSLSSFSLDFWIYQADHHVIRDSGKPLCDQRMPPKCPRTESINFGAFRNASAYHNYMNIYSKKRIFIERYVKQNDSTWLHNKHNYSKWWVVATHRHQGQGTTRCRHIFYSNIHHTDYTQLSFETEVYGVRMLINPDRVSMLLGLLAPEPMSLSFPIGE